MLNIDSGLIQALQPPHRGVGSRLRLGEHTGWGVERGYTLLAGAESSPPQKNCGF